MKKDSPLVSVIIPVYNCEEYIETCIHSICNQSYQNLEILVINDGSNDESSKIIKNKLLDDSRIKYIEKNNEGVSATRNLGLELSKGDFITFVDGDDYIASTFIADAIKYIKKYNLDFILGGTQRFTKSKKSNYILNCDEKIVIYENNLEILKEKFLSNGTVEDRRLDSCFTSGPVCKLFNRKSISKVRFKPEIKIGEDTIFNLEILNKSHRVGIVPDIWYFYRTNEYSATNAYNPNIKEECEKTLNILVKMTKEDKSLDSYLKVRAIQQFHGVLILYPMHFQSKMSYFDIRKYIKSMLKEEPWESILCKNNVLNIPANRMDKLLSVLCFLQSIDLIFITVN